VVYKTSIPTANDDLDVSQVDIQQNFLQANVTMGINHYPFDDATINNGKHKFLDMPATTLPVIAAGDAGFYPKTANGATQLFFTPDNSTNEYQLTRSDAANFGTFSTSSIYPSVPANPSQNGGWTFLPGGLILQYGYVNLLASGSPTPVVYPIAFGASAYSIVATMINQQGNSPSANSVNIKAGSSTNTGFSITTSTSSSAQLVSWIAIGK